MMILCSYSEISGFHGVVAGMLVAIKQLTPETEITVLQIVKLRAKVLHLPPTSPLVASHRHQLCAHAIAGLVCVLLIIKSTDWNIAYLVCSTWQRSTC